MRKIGIRQFQQNFHEELRNLPFVVTKNNEDYCVVTSAPEKEVVTGYSDKPITAGAMDDMKFANLVIPGANNSLQEGYLVGKCQPQNATCKAFGHKYTVIYPSDEGEIKKEVFLCDFHVKKTRDNNLEIREI